MSRMRGLLLLLASLPLAGCGSSAGVSSFHDGTAPGSPWQLVGAGIPARGAERMPPAMANEFSVDFLVLLSNVSDGELYLDGVSIASVAGQTTAYTFSPLRKKVDRMIEEDEDIEVEFVIRINKIGQKQPGRGLPVRVVAHMRDGTGYVWNVEVPSWNLP